MFQIRAREAGCIMTLLVIDIQAYLSPLSFFLRLNINQVKNYYWKINYFSLTIREKDEEENWWELVVGCLPLYKMFRRCCLLPISFSWKYVMETRLGMTPEISYPAFLLSPLHPSLKVLFIKKGDWEISSVEWFQRRDLPIAYTNSIRLVAIPSCAYQQTSAGTLIPTIFITLRDRRCRPNWPMGDGSLLVVDL